MSLERFYKAVTERLRTKQAPAHSFRSGSKEGVTNESCRLIRIIGPVIAKESCKGSREAGQALFTFT